MKRIKPTTTSRRSRSTQPNPIESQQVCSSAEGAIRYGVGNLAAVPGLIKRIIKEELWRTREIRPGKIVELESFRELVTKKPLEGWGAEPSKIEAIIRDDPEALACYREAMKAQGERTDFHDNVMEVESDQGNSRSYTVSRLQKQRPDLFEKVCAGDLSANAAAIEAGWRKVKTPLEQLEHWWKKASGIERKQFMDMAAELEGGDR